MNTARRLQWFAPSLALLLAGCCTPVSTHPLSDEQTSVADPRLLGIWELDSKRDDGQPERMVIRRLRDLSAWKTTLEIVPPIGVASEEQAPVRLYCTKIQGHFYLSWAELRNDEMGTGRQYMITRYEIKQGGQEFWIQVMDCQAVAKEIEAGRLKGEVTYEDAAPVEPPPENANIPPPPSRPMPLGNLEAVLITSTTEDLRAYFAERPQACFSPANPWTLVARRVEGL